MKNFLSEYFPLSITFLMKSIKSHSEINSCLLLLLFSSSAFTSVSLSRPISFNSSSVRLVPSLTFSAAFSSLYLRPGFSRSKINFLNSATSANFGEVSLSLNGIFNDSPLTLLPSSSTPLLENVYTYPFDSSSKVPLFTVSMWRLSPHATLNISFLLTHPDAGNFVTLNGLNLSVSFDNDNLPVISKFIIYKSSFNNYLLILMNYYMNILQNILFLLLILH